MDGSLPAGWLKTNVGQGAISGNASYAAELFTVRGAGPDIWGTSDGFCFVYHLLEGDGQVVARVTSLQRTNLLAKTGDPLAQARILRATGDPPSAWEKLRDMPETTRRS